MITLDMMSIDLPAQDKHASVYSKPVHVSVGPDSTIAEHEGSRSAIVVNHELPISVEEEVLHDLGSRPLSANLPKDLALGQLDGGHGGSHPSIKDFVGDLESTWGNSNNWFLELHDGNQIVIPLSLYHPPGSISNFSEHEGDVGQGNNTFKEEKHIVS